MPVAFVETKNKIYKWKIGKKSCFTPIEFQTIEFISNADKIIGNYDDKIRSALMKK
jgi:hypothetical protein